MFALILSHVVLGCSVNEDRLQYSCDPAINKLVSTNLPIVWKMNRTVWLKLREDFKRAVYRAFTPLQRKELWIAKFAELQSLNWTEKERAHIAEAEQFFMQHNELYSNAKLSDEESNMIDLFFATWMKSAESELGWDKGIAISVAGTPNRIVDTKGTIEIVKRGLMLDYKKGVVLYDNVEVIDTADYTGGELPDDTTGLSSSTDCHCTDKVLSDFCFPLTCTSNWVKCNVTEKGCGWGWQQTCNGVCN